MPKQNCEIYKRSIKKSMTKYIGRFDYEKYRTQKSPKYSCNMRNTDTDEPPQYSCNSLRTTLSPNLLYVLYIWSTWPKSSKTRLYISIQLWNLWYRILTILVARVTVLCYMYTLSGKWNVLNSSILSQQQNVTYNIFSSVKYWNKICPSHFV